MAISLPSTRSSLPSLSHTPSLSHPTIRVILHPTRSSFPVSHPTIRVILHPTRSSFRGLHTSIRPRFQPVSVTSLDHDAELDKIDEELKKIDEELKKIKEADLKMGRKMAYLTVIQCYSSPSVIPPLLQERFKRILRRGTLERKTITLQDLELIVELSR